jgi:hypothetical protein
MISPKPSPTLTEVQHLHFTSEELSIVPDRACLVPYQTFQVHISDPYLKGGIYLYAIKTSMKFDPMSDSMTSATSLRSIDDFVLLYNQLLDDSPCLLIPDLISSVINRFSSGGIIPPHELSNWLFDVLSGCRRGGTYVSTVFDVGQSKCMEAFLFDKLAFSKSLEVIRLNEEKVKHQKRAKLMSGDVYPSNLSPMASTFNAVVKKFENLGCISPGDAAQKTTLAVALFGCSSKVKNPEDFDTLTNPQMISPALSDSTAVSFDDVYHDENQFLLADFFVQKQGLLECIEVLDTAMMMEKDRGDRWRLFAVSLSTLASTERQWGKTSLLFPEDTSKETSKREASLNDHCYNVCEQAAYLLARQKASKFSSSLEVLRDLLMAFHDDLVMIRPAAVKYEQARHGADLQREKNFVAMAKIRAQGSKKQRALGSTTKDTTALAKAVKLYAISGANLHGGLTEMALVSSISYSRLAFQYFSKLRGQARVQAETASDVMDSVSKVKSNPSSGASAPPPMSKEEDLKEAQLLEDILGYIDVQKIGVLPSSDLTHSNFETRWSDRNVDEILRLLSFRSTNYNDITASGSTSVNSNSKMDVFEKYLSRGLLESERRGKILKENALRCVEAISCLTQEVQFDGFMFNVEKTRLHFVTKFVELLARDEEMRPVDVPDSWDPSMSTPGMSSLGSHVCKVIAEAVLAEKAQLKKVRRGGQPPHRIDDP